jgi:hypothetical protein
MNMILSHLHAIPVVIATSARIAPEDRDAKLYYYDLRGDDAGEGIPAQVDTFIRVNHYGTIALTHPLTITLPHDLSEREAVSLLRSMEL